MTDPPSYYIDMLLYIFYRSDVVCDCIGRWSGRIGTIWKGIQSGDGHGSLLPVTAGTSDLTAGVQESSQGKFEVQICVGDMRMRVYEDYDWK